MTIMGYMTNVLPRQVDQRRRSPLLTRRLRNRPAMYRRVVGYISPVLSNHFGQGWGPASQSTIGACKECSSQRGVRGNTPRLNLSISSTADGIRLSARRLHDRRENRSQVVIFGLAQTANCNRICNRDARLALGCVSVGSRPAS